MNEKEEVGENMERLMVRPGYKKSPFDIFLAALAAPGLPLLLIVTLVVLDSKPSGLSDQTDNDEDNDKDNDKYI